jgi:hypothetical protein
MALYRSFVKMCRYDKLSLVILIVQRTASDTFFSGRIFELMNIAAIAVSYSNVVYLGTGVVVCVNVPVFSMHVHSIYR